MVTILEALIFAASAVIVAAIALAALRSILAEVAAWREGRWRSNEVESVRGELRTLESDFRPLPARLLKAEQTLETLKAKASWKS